MSFRKITEMTAYGAFGLARKNPKKGEPYSLKNIANQLRIKDTLNWKGTTPERKVEEKEKKKKKTTNDIKIDKSSSKKKKSKSDKTNTSGPGDANL